MTYLIPTLPAEAANDTTDNVRPEVEVGHFSKQGAHAFQGNVSKLRPSCKTSHDMVALIRGREPHP